MGCRPIHINSITQCPTQITAQNQAWRSVYRMTELKNVTAGIYSFFEKTWDL